MPTLADISRADWPAIYRRALEAAAANLAEAARRRTAAPPDAIDCTLLEASRAEVRVHDAALIRREHGGIGVPPAPFLAPNSEDRATLRDAVVNSLRKDLP